MLQYITKLALITVIVHLGTGCASIVDGGAERSVSIRTNPSDARVSVYNKQGTLIAAQQSPALISLKRSAGYFSPASYRIVVEKDGYASNDFEIKSTINGWYLGNIIFGGVIGILIVDPLTGAMWTLTPNETDLQLFETLGAEGEEGIGLMVYLKDNVPEGLKNKLVKIL